MKNKIDRDSVSHPPMELDVETRSDNDVLGGRWFVNARTARSQFAKIINAARVDRDRVIITEHGAAAVAMIPIRDLRILGLLDQLGLTDKVSDASFKTVSVDELKRLIVGDIDGGQDEEKNDGRGEKPHIDAVRRQGDNT